MFIELQIKSKMNYFTIVEQRTWKNFNFKRRYLSRNAINIKTKMKVTKNSIGEILSVKMAVKILN